MSSLCVPMHCESIIQIWKCLKDPPAVTIRPAGNFWIQCHTAGVLIKGWNRTLLAHQPPPAAPTGQVGSQFPCYTPIITHFLTINPSQIYCRAIIYTEASWCDADPHFSSFSRLQIGRGQVLQRGMQLYLWDQSWGGGGPFGLFGFAPHWTTR